MLECCMNGDGSREPLFVALVEKLNQQIPMRFELLRKYSKAYALTAFEQLKASHLNALFPIRRSRTLRHGPSAPAQSARTIAATSWTRRCSEASRSSLSPGATESLTTRSVVTTSCRHCEDSFAS
jgi:hypothetical protein